MTHVNEVYFSSEREKMEKKRYFCVHKWMIVSRIFCSCLGNLYLLSIIVPEIEIVLSGYEALDDFSFFFFVHYTISNSIESKHRSSRIDVKTLQ
jgi:hypothetical protein